MLYSQIDFSVCLYSICSRGWSLGAQWFKKLVVLSYSMYLQAIRTIKVVEQKLSSGSTSRVIVTIANVGQKELTTKSEIEAAIIEENEKKYHQTEGTSQITSPLLLPLLGKHGEGPAIDQILNGTFNPPPGISQSTIDFLHECKLPDNAPPITTPDIGHRYVSHVKSWSPKRENGFSA
jgi:hypothetical protein